MKAVRVLALVAWVWVGVAAITAWVPVITDPSARLRHMPPALLQHSWFYLFLIPEVVLFAILGFASLATVVPAVRSALRYAVLLELELVLIPGWFAVQAIVLHAFVWTRYLNWAVFATLIGALIAVRQYRHRPDPELHIGPL
jgi:hypothetical protein